MAYDYSRADWDRVRGHLRDVLNSVLLLLLVNFVSGFRLELMYISLIEPRSSPWFSAACAAAIFHRNHFFHL